MRIAIVDFKAGGCSRKARGRLRATEGRKGHAERTSYFVFSPRDFLETLTARSPQGNCSYASGKLRAKSRKADS
jgi:hypothetical protein